MATDRPSDLETLTQIAVAYYADGVTQEAISERFGLSRAKVGRLLKRAREDGVVEVTIRHHPTLHRDLEREACRRFGLDRVLLGLDHQDTDTQRRLLAGQVFTYLERALRDGMVMTAGMGRNVAAVADHAATPTHRDSLFVCAIGGALRAGETLNADHICRRFAQRFGGRSESLYAPAYVEKPEVRDLFMRNATLRDTLDKARRADIALVGIGNLSEDSNMVRMGWFSPGEIATARLCGTAGDLMGYDFFDLDGNIADNGLQGRVIGLSIDDLRRIPTVIAVARESTKPLAILGALRTGVIDVLATSLSNAQNVLALDDELTAKRPGNVL